MGVHSEHLSGSLGLGYELGASDSFTAAQLLSGQTVPTSMKVKSVSLLYALTYKASTQPGLTLAMAFAVVCFTCFRDRQVIRSIAIIAGAIVTKNSELLISGIHGDDGCVTVVVVVREHFVPDANSTFAAFFYRNLIRTIAVVARAVVAENSDRPFAGIDRDD
jgi:hypothetical protein